MARLEQGRLPLPDNEPKVVRTSDEALLLSWRMIGEMSTRLRIGDHSLARRYSDLFIALTQSLADKNPAMGRLNTGFSEAAEESSRYDVRQAARAAFRERPFSGMKTLEIGGPFGQVLHGLGAESWCVDPDIEGESESAGENWRYVPAVRSDKYHPVAARLSMSNWDQVLEPESFDVTFSNHVLSENSGVTSDWLWQVKKEFDPVWNFRAYNQAWMRACNEHAAEEAEGRKDLFTIAAKATKPDGIVIHGGGAVDELLPLSSENGLILKQKRFGHMDGAIIQPVFVFQKTA